ncbi:hypothetical protein LA438_23665, partial [Escherichia coli]|nr:hypothetical protein [Escherichia coli]
AHDVPLGCAPDEYDDLISGTCSHLPFIKVKISCQLKLIRFTGESAIAFSLLSGQKVNGHIGLPA